MFGLTRGQVAESDALLDERVGIQRELFDRLGYFYQVLDMPLNELGAPAYRKLDIEAWMPGRNMYGEISSASNCTDYQSRRLAIRSIDPVSGERRFVHTVNGTACAVPRSLITLLEMGQREDGQVDIPKELQPYCNGLQRLTKPTKPFKLKWIKSKSYEPTTKTSWNFLFCFLYYCRLSQSRRNIQYNFHSKFKFRDIFFKKKHFTIFLSQNP